MSITEPIVSRTFLRLVGALLLPLLAAVLVTACGGDDEGTAGQDPQAVLEQTFSGTKAMRSGKLQLAVKVDLEGGASQTGGPMSLRLSGPFATDDPKRLPRFDLAVSVRARGQGFDAGAVSTGTKGFLRLQGRTYAVGEELYESFRTGYARAQREAKDPQGGGTSLRALGVDPRRWLERPTDEGVETVGGAPTAHIASDVDVPRFLDDVERLLANAGRLGGSAAAGTPDRLTDGQRRQIEQAVKGARVDVWTGEQDRILRRLRVVIDVEGKGLAGAALGSGRIAVDYLVADLNREQRIEEPRDARPLSELTGALKGLGLGGLGGGSGGSGSSGSSGSGSSGSGSSGSGSSGSGSSGSSDGGGDAYLSCLDRAGGDVAAVRACARELATP